MRKKLITILIVLSFLNFAGLAILFFPTTAVTSGPIVYEPMDISSRIREQAVDFTKELEHKGIESFGIETSSDVGDVVTWIWYDDMTGLYTADYTLISVGTYCELWLCTFLEWANTSDPYYPDPRPVPVVTQAQADYMVNEFDTNMYTTCQDYFGIADFHDGSGAALPYDYFSEDGKVAILVSNIGDENYYDWNYPYYIAGFYWGSVFEHYCDRNVISIDAYAWEYRTGDVGNPDTPWQTDPDKVRPYLYEGVFAHEFQHLIHADAFPYISDVLWMNEGCSMFSEILCGYTVPFGDINSFFATPDNGLTDWGDQGGINILADYGQAFLFATYLVDFVSPSTRDFLKQYMAQGKDPLMMDQYLPGIELLDYMIDQYKPDWDFEKVFKKWTLANLLPWHPGYTSIDWSHEDMGDGVRIYENTDKWPTGVTGTSFGTTITILGYDTGVDTLGAYGTDYILLKKLKKNFFSKLSFNGLTDKIYDPMWIQEDTDDDGELEWYTGDPGGYADISLVTEVDLAGESSADLTFRTFYGIEWEPDGGWDFGFVQVSPDGGETWISLENEHTTYDSHPNAQTSIVAELPGLNGYPEDIIDPMTFSLDDYLVDGLLIRFRYMTDQLYQDYGWWIEDVMVNGEPVPEFGPAWSNVDYFVHVVRVDYWKGNPIYTYIKEMKLNDDNEGYMYLAPFLLCGRPDVLLLVSADTTGVDYEFSVTSRFKCWNWRPCMW